MEETVATTWRHEQSTILLLDLFSKVITEIQSSLCWLSTHALGRLTFTVSSNDRNAAEFLTRCLLDTHIKETTTRHLQIFICSGSLPPYLAPPNWNFPHTDQRHRERLHLTPDGKISAFYDQARSFWAILDMNTRRALLWCADTKQLPEWEAAAPFKQILQWSLVSTSSSMLHGGAVALENHSVLLVGPGGSGKSTTVAACLQAGLGVCGDDLIVVDHSKQNWYVHAVYDAIKLLPSATIAAPPILNRAPWRECGDKRLVRYSDVKPGALVHTAPLRALMHCKITGNKFPRLVPVSPAEMHKAIGPPTAFLLRGRETHILKKVSAMVRALPCLRLELGRNPGEAAGLLRHWLENYSAGGDDD